MPKGSYGYGESRYVFRKSVQYPHLPVRAVKKNHPEGGGIGPGTESCVIVMDLSPWYRLCTKEIFIPKGSYRYGETRNVFR